MDRWWAICRRDLVAAFTTPLAWLVLASWTFLTNTLFADQLYVVHGTAGADQPLYVQTLHWGVFFLCLLAPAVTMNSFASERSQGTMQLLLTMPVREYQLVLGKYAAALLVLASMVAATLVQPAVLVVISQIKLPHLLAGYAGLLACVSLFAALGVWISLLVDSPVAAYVLTMGAIMALILVGIGGVGADAGWMGRLAAEVGLTARTAGFFRGDLGLGDIAFFLCGTAAFLCLAHASLCARRIHG